MKTVWIVMDHQIENEDRVFANAYRSEAGALEFVQELAKEEAERNLVFWDDDDMNWGFSSLDSDEATVRVVWIDATELYP